MSALRLAVLFECINSFMFTMHAHTVCGLKPSARFLGQLHLPTGTLELITHGAVEEPRGTDQKHSAP